MDQQSAQDRVVAATHETFYAQLVNEALASLHLHVPCFYFILSFVLVLKNGSGQELSPLHPGRIFFFPGESPRNSPSPGPSPASCPTHSI